MLEVHKGAEIKFNHLCTADNCISHLLNPIVGVSFKHPLKRVLALPCSEKVNQSIILFLPEVNHLSL